MSFVAPTITATANSPGGLHYDFQVFKNGVSVSLLTNQTGSTSVGVTVADGDVVTATATSVADPTCVASASCTRANIPAQPSCTYFNPSGLTSGACYAASSIAGAFLANTSRSAVIAGLTGDMAPLNGTYTVDCASPGAGATVSWSGGGYAYNFGSVGLVWASEFTYSAQVTCTQSNSDSCVLLGNICNPGDATRRIGFVKKETTGGGATFNYQFKPATCGVCSNTSRFYETAASMISSATTNGSPAELATITWL